MNEKVLDAVKVVIGIGLLVLSIIMVIDTYPTLKDYIKQKIHGNESVLSAETTEKEVEIEENANEQQVNKATIEPHHTHSFVIVAKTITVQDASERVKEIIRQCYRCDCGLELEMKGR